ncbi:MAG: metal-dependent hydrolase [Gemmatimonadales bacterium]
MIVGHVGIAFGARALDRREEHVRAPLLWLLAASVAPDMLDGVLALGQYCNPEGVFTHSLPAAAILAAIFGVAAFLHTRSAATGLLVAALVMLHLPPDYLTGRKALWPGGPVAGLYIYRWGWLDFLAELPIVAGGWWLLRRARFTPRWVVSGLALAALLAIQGAFDASTQVNGPRTPRVCTR